MDVKIGHTLGAEVRVLTESLKKRAHGKRVGADHFCPLQIRKCSKN
jgi:uncharacterized zinc-type alcohol dehydrogenase-like protein